MENISQIYSTDVFIIFLSAISYFTIFALTSLINYIDLRRGRVPETHVSSLLSGKIVNILFISIVAIASFVDLIPAANFFDYLYLMVCVNVAIKINWNLFAATDTSMHVRLLTLVNEYKFITHADLLSKYNRNVIFNARIPRLLALNQLKIVDDKYLLCGKFVLFGGVILAFFRLILGLPVRPATYFENEKT